ncbi:hypothetical protein Rhe02_81310 [Rhizocola hellebori]|uniref:DUF6879 domain-containing protein n=1 Tax=Rhizocola hellebori TaxID=1392758 RepID=A0A8J3QFM5_9ACTN|nr:DUF6879 family protein [Rhizocola hellebori]GIH10064.1 hypothetical protein Rhe02_81310 [Rhizocola hellebori]
MIEKVRDTPGEMLALAKYRAAFWQVWPHIPDRFDKLERQQHFQELDTPSWDAASAGDWQLSLELMQTAGGPELITTFARRRLRVVELPVTPYLQWELHWYRRPGNEDEQIRVIDPAAIAGYETAQLLPELVILGPLAMFEVIYNQEKFLAGGRQILAHDIIAACRADFEQLWEQGEDLDAFFTREIAPLPPPTMSHK